MPVELTAWGHDPSDSNVYVDPSHIIGASEGDIAELWQPRSSPKKRHSMSSSDNDRKSGRRHSKDSISSNKLSDSQNSRRNVYFQISIPKQAPSNSTPSKPNLPTISVSTAVLSTLGIRPRSQVHVRLLNLSEVAEKVRLDVVEIHFRGVYLTRNDHYKIAKSISGKCVSSGQKIGYLNDCVRLTVETLYRGGKRKFSGFIGDDTRLVFRSDSARILIFIQMSSEMWNFDETGDIMFHRLVNSFIPEMLHRWHTQGDSHLVSIVLFTSVATHAQKGKTKRLLSAGEPVHETYHFYRVVVDSVHISRWSDIMRMLRSEFESFPQEVLEDPETHELLGSFLPSSKSNILEAFSLATTLLTSKFTDRDLCRTGVQAMVATAGPACFDVDLSELWSLSRRLLGVEIGIELVCLARPPLHVSPLFRALLPSSENDPSGIDECVLFGNWRQPANTRLVFCVPTWINMSFWESPDKYKKQWIPRCKIYDLQTSGNVESEARSLDLKSFQFDASDLTHSFMRSFDASVFKSVDMIESQKRIEVAANSANSAELRPRNEVLDKGVPASAVTTVAVAIPEKSNSRIDAYKLQNRQKPLDTVNGKASKRSKDNSEVAKLSLGALLGPSACTDASINKVHKSSSLWSMIRSSRSSMDGINTISDTSSSSSCVNKEPNHTKASITDPSASRVVTSDIEHSNLPNVSPSTKYVTKLIDDGIGQPQIYISTPSRKVGKSGRRDSRLSKSHLQLSPSSSKRHLSPRSPSRKILHGRRASVIGNSSSPDHERKFYSSAGSPSNRGHNGYHNNWKNSANNMCDTSRPELQNPSMWRVLPNSATIDHPTPVAAYGRWANVYPPNRHLNGVSWHSLKSPASLPLTSESFPSLVAFREHYNFQFYDVAVDNDEMPLSLLLDEMIGLRLQLGFQIAVGTYVKAVEASLPRGNPSRVVPIVPRETKDCIGIRIYLTRMGLVHRLAVDDDHTVDVRLYTWIDRNARWLKSPLTEKRQEEVKIKSRFEPQYKRINKQFLDQGLEHLNWSMLDQQVSGADDPLLYPSSANTQNLVTIRYVLLPADATVVPGLDTLSVEEGHVEGITRIVRLLLRNREAGSIDSDFIVHYYTGKLSKSIGEIVQESSSALNSNRLNKSISLEDLAAEMKGAMGLKFRDRRWHWKQFRHVFTGHDFVIWLMKTFEDINTAEDAEAYGVNVMARGLIRHPENRHPFIHGHYFYELTDQYSDSNKKQNEEKPVESNSTDTSLQPTNSQLSVDTQSELPKKNRAKVHVSESFVINVDPRGISGRPERVKVSIDRMHNPKNAFHILVEWLSITPRLVDDLFSNAGRLASQYGLRLVQVPVADVHGSLEDSPFRSSMRVKPAIELSDAQEYRWFHHYLLRRSGYVLDVYDRQDISSDEYEVLFFWGRLRSSYPQYIHSSGFVLVQIESNNGHLCITPNTLHLSRAVLAGNHSGTNADSECENLMRDLYNLCLDGSKLQTLLKEGREHRMQSRPVSSVSILQSKENPRESSKDKDNNFKEMVKGVLKDKSTQNMKDSTKDSSKE